MHSTRFGWDAELLLPKILTEVMLLCKRFGPVTQFAELFTELQKPDKPTPFRHRAEKITKLQQSLVCEYVAFIKYHFLLCSISGCDSEIHW